MKRALVSVLMPAYNAAPYIAEAIESIIAQSYQDWELLVCDDGSSDQTPMIVERYKDPRIKLLRNERNIGYLRTCNRLFIIAKGDFVTFQDADDFCTPDRIEKLVSAFAANPSAGMIGSASTIVGVDGSVISVDVRPTDRQAILDGLLHGSQFNGATVMVRREVLDVVGGYREYFNEFAYQDYDWTCRIAEKYHSFNIPDVLYAYRQQPSSNSKKVSVKRAISKDLVMWLAKDRRINGSDCLDRGEVDEVNRFVALKCRPYDDDLSLVFREYAATFMYSRLYKRAVGASVAAIRANPGKFVNYRTLFYCVRKSLFS